MVELVYTLVLEASAERLAGSSPVLGTTLFFVSKIFCFRQLLILRNRGFAGTAHPHHCVRLSCSLSIVAELRSTLIIKTRHWRLLLLNVVQVLFWVPKKIRERKFSGFFLAPRTGLEGRKSCNRGLSLESGHFFLTPISLSRISF